MYTKDKNNRITLRLSDEQYAYVREEATFMDVTPSEYVRMLINVCKVSSETIAKKIAERGASVREDVKADIDDLV